MGVFEIKKNVYVNQKSSHFSVVAGVVGTFGRVLECWDRETKEYVAVKIIRSIKKYRDAAMIEIDVLQKLVKTDKGRKRYFYMNLLLADCEE